MITSGSGVAVHIWGDTRIVKQFRTTKNNNGWDDWSKMVSGIYEAEGVAEKIACRRGGPYWCYCFGRYHFRLSGDIEYDQCLDEDDCNSD